MLISSFDALEPLLKFVTFKFQKETPCIFLFSRKSQGWGTEIFQKQFLSFNKCQHQPIHQDIYGGLSTQLCAYDYTVSQAVFTNTPPKTFQRSPFQVSYCQWTLEACPLTMVCLQQHLFTSQTSKPSYHKNNKEPWLVQLSELSSDYEPKVAGLISSQGTCLGCRPGPQ